MIARGGKGPVIIAGRSRISIFIELLNHLASVVTARGRVRSIIIKSVRVT